jgi:hypothetical protein
MKRKGLWVAAAVALIFLLAAPLSADNWKGGPGHSGYRHGDRDDRGGYHDRGRDEQRRDEYRRHEDRGGRWDYRGYRGYRERPHDRGRHYGHYKHRGHRYDYEGHWRSWDQWDRYARHHDLYRHGHYYREGGHLMFRFCEPGSEACFFFSIGR